MLFAQSGCASASPAGNTGCGQGRSSLLLQCCLSSRSFSLTMVCCRRSAWIVIDKHAKRSFMHADKRSLIIQLGLGIPIRDMRLLDFNLLSSGGWLSCHCHSALPWPIPAAVHWLRACCKPPKRAPSFPCQFVFPPACLPD